MILRSIFFFSLSLIWSTVNSLMHLAVASGILRGKRLPCRVVSVGNLQSGGTGKTPLVREIAREALDRGLKVCILSRGYGSEAEQSTFVLNPGHPPDSEGVRPEVVGDEPLLLFQELKHAFVAVGSDRVYAFQRAIESLRETQGESARFDLVVLDDGFQHWRIQKDLEIVALGSRTPWQAVFRDFSFWVSRADLVVWTKGQTMPHALPARYARIRYRYRAANLERARGRRVWLVTGVGDGVHVRDDLQEQGVTVDRHLDYKDHHHYTLAEVNGILATAVTDGILLALTGKDWVKWQSLLPTSAPTDSIIVIEPEIEWVHGRELWEKTLWS